MGSGGTAASYPKKNHWLGNVEPTWSWSRVVEAADPWGVMVAARRPPHLWLSPGASWSQTPTEGHALRLPRTRRDGGLCAALRRLLLPLSRARAPAIGLARPWATQRRAPWPRGMSAAAIETAQGLAEDIIRAPRATQRAPVGRRGRATNRPR